MLIRMLYQSWKYGIKRKLLAILTLCLAAGLISSLLAVSLDIGDKMAKELKSYGANILIEPAALALLPENERPIQLAGENLLDQRELSNVKDIFWRNNIIGFAPLLQAEATINQKTVTLLGTFFDQAVAIDDEPDFHTGQKIISPYWQVEGEWVDDQKLDFSQPIPALLGAELAQSQAWQIGQTLRLAYQPIAPVATTRENDKENNRESNGGKIAQNPPRFLDIVIKGILTTGGAEQQQILLPLQSLQQLTNLTGKIQAIKVSALTVPENALSRKARANVEALDAEEYDRWYCTAYVSSIAHQLEQAISGSTVRPIWQVAASEGVIIAKIQMLLAVVTLAAVAVAAMGIASIMGTAIIERSKEIGLMKALGAFSWQIALLFYCEMLLNALIGGLLGCLGGWLLARFIGQSLFASPLTFPLILVPCVLAIAVFIGLVGTWFPAQRITKCSPREVLYGR